MARPRDRSGFGRGLLDHSLHLRHHGPIEEGRPPRPPPRSPPLRAIGCINAASDPVACDKLTERDEALAYLPLAWVGDHYLNYAQALVAAFCLACPESSDTAMADMKEIGPTFFFAPPRVFEQMLTRLVIRMEDAGRVKRALFRYFIGVARRHGERLLNRQHVPVIGRFLYAVGKIAIYAPLMNVLG